MRGYSAHITFKVPFRTAYDGEVLVKRDYVDCGETFEEASEALYEAHSEGRLYGFYLFSDGALVCEWNEEDGEPFPLGGTDGSVGPAPEEAKVS